MNDLGSIIKNDAARRVIYATWFIAGIIIGAVQVGFADPDPEWITTTFNVWSYLGIPIAALATANTNTASRQITPLPGDYSGK